MSKPINEQQKYIDIIAAVDAGFKKMRSLRPIPAVAVKRYIEEFAISNTHESNAIEGSTFTYDETRLLLKEGVVFCAKSMAEHEEIKGYKKGFDFLYKSVKECIEIDENFIRELNRFVRYGQEEPGEFRKEQVYIGDMFNVTYTPPPPEAVSEKIRAYTAEVREDIKRFLHIKEANSLPDWYELFHVLAKHHIEFERIHPFLDGNGRTGRLLLLYEMIMLGLLPMNVRYEMRERYYAAFARYNDKVKYSTRGDSATEGMAKLLAECECASMEVWNKMFASYE